MYLFKVLQLFNNKVFPDPLAFKHSVELKRKAELKWFFRTLDLNCAQSSKGLFEHLQSGHSPSCLYTV